MQIVELDGQNLSRASFLNVVRGFAECRLSYEAVDKVRSSRAMIEQVVSDGQTVYGVTTGFGKLSDVRIEDKDVNQLQLNLVRSHAIGVGKPFPTDVVRGMLLLRANALAKGFSGISSDTLQRLIDLLNHRVHPIVPSQGSLGASGDLAPLAHIALVLIGEGKAEVNGHIMSGLEALQSQGLTPVRLGAKEGLALINGTQAMTSVGLLTVSEAEQIGVAADVAVSLTMEALQGIVSPFRRELLQTRGHAEQVHVADRILDRLQGSKRVTTQGEVRVQDAYSIRCVPQVHGASWQALGYVKEKLEVEMNSATDNPIVLASGEIVSGGQFHGQPIAIAMDFLKIAVAEWASISERRIERLVNPQLSGLSPFLAHQPGLESGLMIAQYVAAALVSENKVLAHPASVDSIPSSANQEDHVSMGTIAARQARDIVQNASRVIAIELICATEAIEMQGIVAEISAHSRHAVEKVRQIVPAIQGDRSLSEDVENLSRAVLEPEFWH